MKRHLLTSVLALFVFAIGCSSEPPPTQAKDAVEHPPELAVVTDDRKDLLFRYRTDGGFAQATTIGEIPSAVRSKVQVVDLSMAPKTRGAAKFVQVFDLTAPGANGQYSGQLLPRSELEAALAKRNQAPKQAPIIMYSTSWCGVCTKARSFMRAQNLIFVEKDIEKDKTAARELAMKGRKTGVRTSGVPVFDIGGQLISGFDPNTIAKLAKGTKK